MMTEQRSLPDDAEAYGKTPVFTNETVPDKILNHHDLQAGTWGLLTVESGTVSFFRKGDEAPLAVISSEKPFVILPEEVHYVRLSEDAKFFVTFYKRPKS
ncbi:MAG: DUF1971 domain-containing protein [Nitrospira sp.]|nr:DUF1971 domain-containing protein [Nitrospira sp.]MCY3954430.1 DUF1971 domain-containing protein [Nitrospira sp.]